MRVERTRDAAKTPLAGFEDREDHRTPFASASKRTFRTTGDRAFDIAAGPGQEVSSCRSHCSCKWRCARDFGEGGIGIRRRSQRTPNWRSPGIGEMNSTGPVSQPAWREQAWQEPALVQERQPHPGPWAEPARRWRHCRPRPPPGSRQPN